MDVEALIDDTTTRSQKLNQRISEQPRYRRQMIWDTHSLVRSRTVCWTESADPLPSPPPEEFHNVEALQTIRSHPDLFKVSTPIDIDRFQGLLIDHPNQPFVLSVCTSLREGFWPFANTHYGEWPTTWDCSHRPPKSRREAAFLREQVQTEVQKGRYSPSFGPDLLPGMYSMPIHAVPKPGTNKFRLVTDHSASDFALNNMITREDIAGVTLDNVQDLGNALRLLRRLDPQIDLILWKADVSEAYRQMPMHPLWQIKQIVTIDSNRHVDRRNVFGNRASQRVFHAFMSLVIWIAVMKLRISFLYIYVDDSFSAQRRGETLFYKRYSKSMPSNLVRFLRLWDRLGIPHEEKKQVFGDVLPIIGFEVDPNRMLVSLSAGSRAQLIQALQNFGQHGTQRTLKDFQRIAGHLNWALNVYPLLRPGLCSLYAKTAGKLHQHAPIWVNRNVERELNWVIHHLTNSDGVFLLNSESWSYRSLPDSVLRVYCDASPFGLAFWIPSRLQAFQFPTSDLYNQSGESIFYLEALTVCAALLHAISVSPIGARIAVFTDNLNSVQMFNSLAALPSFNWMLIVVVDAVIAREVDFRVLHVPGIHNTVADMLSRFRNDEVLHLQPGLDIQPFQPPQVTLGAIKN